MPSPQLSQTPWMAEMRWERTRDCSSILDEELLAFERYIQPSRAEVNLRWEVFHVLSDLLEKAFPGIIVMPYGSLQSELFLPDADIDVMIQYNASRTPQLLLPVILSLLNRTTFMKLHSGFPVLNTPVPVLRFTTLPRFGSFKIDITLNIDDGIAGTKKLEELFKEDWAFRHHRRERARRLTLFVKFFLQHHKYYGTACKGLTGLAVSCMVIAYFKIETKNQLSEPTAGEDLIDFLEFYAQKDDPRRISIESPLRPKEDLAAKCVKSSAILKTFDETAYSLGLYDRRFAYSTQQNFSDLYYAKDSILATVMNLKITAESQRSRANNVALAEKESVSFVLDHGGVAVGRHVVQSVQSMALPPPAPPPEIMYYGMGAHFVVSP